MTLYVTDLRAQVPGRADRYARLTADTGRELILAAARLELAPGCRFPATTTTPEHYVISPAQRAAALVLGAVARTHPSTAPALDSDQTGLFPTTPEEGDR